MQIQLLNKTERERSSHEIAVDARAQVTQLVEGTRARFAVVEMPPGPPVLQSVVAEIYGPDAKTRREFARDMTEMFEQAESITDVDNLMQEPYEIWRFEADRDKALRKGEIRVNKGRVKPDYRLVTGDRVRIPPLRVPAPSEPPTIPRLLCLPGPFFRWRRNSVRRAIRRTNRGDGGSPANVNRRAISFSGFRFRSS